jgi:DNA polymerase-1
VLANHGLRFAGVAHDTELESYVLESHKPHEIENLAWRHLDLTILMQDDVTGKGAKRIAFEQVPVERAAEYAVGQADALLRLHRHLYPQIARDDKLRRIYETIELPVRDVLFKMERTGVLIDGARLAAQGQALGERVVALEQRPSRKPERPSTWAHRGSCARSCSTACACRSSSAPRPASRRRTKRCCRSSRPTIRCRS